MEPLHWALLLKPLGFLAFVALVAYCGLLAKRHLPEGRMKRVLTRPLWYADWERRP